VSLEDWKTLAETAQATVTSLAVVLGGIWAYFKLIKGRTFTQRVKAEIDANWLANEGHPGLLVRLRLENIGGAKVRMQRAGTGVQISHIAKEQEDAPSETRWQYFRVFDAFVTHAWIEPGETIADELLIRLPVNPELVEVKMRIVLERWARKNTTVQARRISRQARALGALQVQRTTQPEEHDDRAP
jgi:hypothetical protein